MMSDPPPPRGSDDDPIDPIDAIRPPVGVGEPPGAAVSGRPAFDVASALDRHRPRRTRAPRPLAPPTIVDVVDHVRPPTKGGVVDVSARRERSRWRWLAAAAAIVAVVAGAGALVVANRAVDDGQGIATDDDAAHDPGPAAASMPSSTPVAGGEGGRSFATVPPTPARAAPPPASNDPLVSTTSTAPPSQAPPPETPAGVQTGDDASPGGQVVVAPTSSTTAPIVSPDTEPPTTDVLNETTVPHTEALPDSTTIPQTTMEPSTTAAPVTTPGPATASSTSATAPPTDGVVARRMIPSIEVSHGIPADGQPGCDASSCRYVAASVAGLAANAEVDYGCHSSRHGRWADGTLTTDADGGYDGNLTCFYGYPGDDVWVVIDGVESNRITW